jgi:hypothetical protein
MTYLANSEPVFKKLYLSETYFISEEELEAS